MAYFMLVEAKFDENFVVSTINPKRKSEQTLWPRESTTRYLSEES